MKYSFLVKCLTHCGEEMHGRLAILRTDKLEFSGKETDDLSLFPSGSFAMFCPLDNGSSAVMILHCLPDLTDEILATYARACKVSDSCTHPTDVIEAKYVYSHDR